MHLGLNGERLVILGREKVDFVMQCLRRSTVLYYPNVPLISAKHAFSNRSSKTSPIVVAARPKKSRTEETEDETKLKVDEHLTI